MTFITRNLPFFSRLSLYSILNIKKKRTGHANSKQNLGCALYKSGHVFINFIYVTLKKTFNIVNAILLVALVAMGVLKNKILPVIFPGKQN